MVVMILRFLTISHHFCADFYVDYDDDDDEENGNVPYQPRGWSKKQVV